MGDNINQSDSQEDITNWQPSDVAGSPGSQSNSSSLRRRRVVELIQENDSNNQDDQPADWIIRAEFYEEDVAQNNNDYDETDDEDDPDFELPDNFSESDDIGDDDDDVVMDGFVLAPDEQTSSDTDNEDHDADPNYDTTLPVGHRYLGDDLEESRGRRVLAEGSHTHLHLINLHHIVLFPGQTLPIMTQFLNRRIHEFLKSCIVNGSMTIGIMSEPRENPIGTTAEIRNFREEEDELKVIIEGRQRFKLLSPPFEIAITGDVEILPEINLGSPYPKISYLQRFNAIAKKYPKLVISKHPNWVLRIHEARYVMEKIMDQVRDWFNRDSIEDPNDFSYWVASNLPISNRERMKALAFHCTEARLMWTLDMLEKCIYFECSSCLNIICRKKDVFPMSSTGPQCSFVNPHGFIHDTLTVRCASGLIYDHGWSNEYSWFPGYAWKTANCENCNRHIGWCYKSIDLETKPKRFFGLSRANIRLKLTKVEDINTAVIF